MITIRRWTAAGTPVLSPEEEQALKEFLAVQEAHQDELQAITMKAASEHPELGPLVKSMSPAQIDEQNRVSRELTRRAIGGGEWGPYLDNLRAQGCWRKLPRKYPKSLTPKGQLAPAPAQGSAYAKMGLSFTSWFDLVSSLQAALIPLLLAGASPQRAAAALLGMATYLDIGMAVLGEEYLRTKEQIINQQQSAIRELSTPVLQIRDRMLILPIIGVIDTQRARQLTEQLLHAIRAHRAKAVVMDITGVAAVDSKVANHLLQTISAARLMGARVVVTGVSSEVAHALVTLGVDTGQIHTTGDLQSGIEEVERWLGYELVRLDRAAGTGALAAEPE